MNALNLSPLFRTTVGFDRLADLMDSAMDAKVPNYPPYNIEATGQDTYTITIAAAGFGRDDLELSAEDQTLTVRGHVKAEEEKSDEAARQYLYRGIAERSFERKFNLADHVRVTGAELKDGMLAIRLAREVPEQLKPRSIPIK